MRLPRGLQRKGLGCSLNIHLLNGSVCKCFTGTKETLEAEGLQLRLNCVFGLLSQERSE